METNALNVFGKPLEKCSGDPLTGFYRDGCCTTGKEDVGMHTVCIVADEIDMRVKFNPDQQVSFEAPFSKPPDIFNHVKP